MNPRNRRQTVTKVFDGRTHHVALCRGERDGLPVFGWSEAPSTLLTRSQLRAVGLRPNGQDPSALLVFRHHLPYARETTAELFSVELAAPYRPPTPAQLTALDRAMEARRTCVDCAGIQDYCVPTSTRQCWTCFDLEQADRAGVAA
ncbi:hypothetical protein OHS58_34050 [Amycolatopsis sp. NBC_00348]|uniref:RRQRL motif-containing zinc-binding protein n=1 Tax=Amycolatopsis sp. NBC_00348 TaxID=2975956 RepID=UPI002E26C11F